MTYPRTKQKLQAETDANAWESGIGSAGPDGWSVRQRKRVNALSEDEKRQSGLLFCPGDPELVRQKRRAHGLSREFNALEEGETARRKELLRQLFASVGEGVLVTGPVYVHYGIHTSIGDHFFANFNLTIQDDARVTIGHNCNFGPNVTIVTPQHPLLPDERRQMADRDGKPVHLCYAQPVEIGDDCWFGANVVVCPGVRIGSGCVIGAGSVVTHDIPDRSVAAGNPCRVLRTLSEQDSLKYRPELLGDCSVL